MRKFHEALTAAFAVAAAGVATIVLLPTGEPGQRVTDTRTVTVEDHLDYEGAAEVTAGRITGFVRAVEAHQLTEWSAAVDRQKAEAAARESARRVTTTRAEPVPRQYVDQPAVIPSGSVWDRLAQCEAGGNWSHPPVGPMPGNPSSYSGGLMFDYKTWNAYGGRDFTPAAWQASREQQIVIAERILADVGWGAWPACSRKLGLR